MKENLENRSFKIATGVAGGLLALSTISGCSDMRSDKLSYAVICPEDTELQVWQGYDVGAVDMSCTEIVDNPDEYRDEYAPLGVVYIPKDGDYSQSGLNAFQLDVGFEYLDQPGADFLNNFNFNYELSDGYVPEDFVVIGGVRKSLIIGCVLVNDIDVKEI